MKKKLISCSVAAAIALVFSVENELKTSQSALKTLAGFEGCYLTPYQCSATVWTDGIGNTNGVDSGKPISLEQVAEQFTNNVMVAEQAVTRCINVPLEQYQFDSFVLFTFNVGETAFCESTLAKKANGGDIKSACNELKRWIYSKGRVVQGLINRRDIEFQICSGTYYE